MVCHYCNLTEGRGDIHYSMQQRGGGESEEWGSTRLISSNQEPY